MEAFLGVFTVQNFFPLYLLLLLRIEGSVVAFLDDIILWAMQVLIATSISAAIGQVSKPFSSTILYGKTKDFDIRTAFMSGGFPSTHSSVNNNLPKQPIIVPISSVVYLGLIFSVAIKFNFLSQDYFVPHKFTLL